MCGYNPPVRYFVWFMVMLSGCAGGCGGGSGDTPAPSPLAVVSSLSPGTATPTSPKYLFSGDSLTQFWQPPCFPSANAGVGGETSVQIAAHFQQDLANSGAAVVFLMAGTNDLLYSATPPLDSMRAMILVGKQANVSMVLAEIPPINFALIPWLTPDNRVQNWNASIRGLATQYGLNIVDYFAPMADANGMQLTYLFKDNVHPNADGYAVMCAVIRGV